MWPCSSAPRSSPSAAGAASSSCRADAATVQEARRQLESLESLWLGRLDRFGEALADRPEEQDP